MKAITFNEFGDADVLKLANVPDPELRPTIFWSVYAAGVNRADLTHRRGGYGRPNFETRPSWGWKSPVRCWK